MSQSLIAILILLPVFAGLICLNLKDYKLRAIVITATSLILMAASLLLFSQGALEYTPPAHAACNTIIVGLDYVLLVYFLYLGISRRSILVIIFSLAQIAPLTYFDIFMHPEEATPALFIDQLSLIMCLIISIIGSLICLYGIRYMRDHEEHLNLKVTRQPRFFFWLIAFLGAMNGLVLANDIFWLYFFWEVTTLCCYQLIHHDLTAEAERNALRALWMCSLGGTAFAFAIISIFSELGTLSLQSVIEAESIVPLLIPLALLCLTGFTKSAQLPFQSWLLGAMVAPTPVSALLHSSTMVNAGVYLVIRLTPAFRGTPLSTTIAIFGGFVFLSTAVLAISQTGAKRLLAYSTISNLGLIFCCAGINTSLAIAAAITLLVFHAISKGLLFLCVGIIESNTGSRDIEPMEGLITRFPVITSITVAGIISMAFMPFGVLVSKWAGIEAAASSPSAWVPVICALLVGGSAATVVFWVKWMGCLLCRMPGAEATKAETLPLPYISPVAFLLIVAVALSIFVAPFFDQIIRPAILPTYSVPFTIEAWHLRTAIGFFAPWPLAVVAAAVLALPWAIIKVKKKQVRAVYMCGENVEYSHPQFRTVSGARMALETGRFYLERTLGESNLNRLVNPVAIIILLALFWVVAA